MAEGLSKIDDVVINGMPVREGAPHILSVSFLGFFKADDMQGLERHKGYVKALQESGIAYDLSLIHI